MNIFSAITLFGGLAMFLYGMRMMGDGLKASSSGTLKKAMERVTGTPLKAFLLGMVTTAVVQSSTATIVITSGLVGAGIISLRQSLGIIIGANVGTTVTGQIIRLLDLNTSGAAFLQFLKPSTLAPLALIIGIIIVMGMKSKDSGKIGQIIIGFGILFSGLLNMTDAVSALTDSGIVERLFSGLGSNPLIGYAAGAGVAFVLQSSSATIGILQAFSTSGQLTFGGIYAVLVGIYLGDCVTTAIVCNIGAKPEAKRVGIVNILFNLSESVVILVAVAVIHKMGLLNGIWNSAIHSGGIANTNTIFNLSCAVLLMPFVGVYEKISYRIIKDEPVAVGKYDEMLDALNPVFISTPALAFGRCYDVLMLMCQMARTNINRAFDMFTQYDPKVVKQIEEDEDDIDNMADRVSNYLVQISAAITTHHHVEIMNYYYSAVTEFERLGDHALNIAEIATELKEEDNVFTKDALSELTVLRELLDTILGYTSDAFKWQKLEAARQIEPLEEVVDDMVNVLKNHHLERLRGGACGVFNGTEFFNLLSEAERISDVCSNVGVATVARATPGIKHQVHDYISMLHSGRDEDFNRAYQEAHDRYFRLLQR
ncbi:Na/Pi cotransporter family protein [Lacrimispora sp. 210928-DFI.3.58]|uniref:Na/Pi cotransporter family protein n=1 Tax=Lacrimispora sp. 210928-DFI.3.58 TaxID=2883214 RepID=UPI001D069655|nr:Na/Pi cotransporter family protein [Lacrimispora sp. 210928-DFI.3.58]MCB7317972.1 Na/Pi cotransporter family protein [Lacrimispora sp. 210928-DFI.3.58]